MLEKPFFWKFARIGEVFDGKATDGVDGLVKLCDLGGSECVGVLFGVDAGVIEDLISVEFRRVGIVIDGGLITRPSCQCH